MSAGFIATSLLHSSRTFRICLAAPQTCATTDSGHCVWLLKYRDTVVEMAVRIAGLGATLDELKYGSALLTEHWHGVAPTCVIGGKTNPPVGANYILSLSASGC